MRLDPPPKHAMRVHELAKELGVAPPASSSMSCAVVASG